MQPPDTYRQNNRYSQPEISHEQYHPPQEPVQKIVQNPSRQSGDERKSSNPPRSNSVEHNYQLPPSRSQHYMSNYGNRLLQPIPGK